MLVRTGYSVFRTALALFSGCVGTTVIFSGCSGSPSEELETPTFNPTPDLSPTPSILSQDSYRLEEYKLFIGINTECDAYQICSNNLVTATFAYAPDASEEVNIFFNKYTNVPYSGYEYGIGTDSMPLRFVANDATNCFSENSCSPQLSLTTGVVEFAFRATPSLMSVYSDLGSCVTQSMTFPGLTCYEGTLSVDRLDLLAQTKSGETVECSIIPDQASLPIMMTSAEIISHDQTSQNPARLNAVPTVSQGAAACTHNGVSLEDAMVWFQTPFDVYLAASQ